MELARAGCCNLARHVENCRKYGVHVVVALNKFVTDTDAELAAVRDEALAAGARRKRPSRHGLRKLPGRRERVQGRRAGAFDAVVCEHWEKGGAGTVGLVEAVQKACKEAPQFRFLYELDQPIKAKIEKIAVEMYRADGVDYLPEAEAAIDKYTALGFDKLPICMAKTQYSFSHDAKRKGAPTGFRLPIR